VGCAGGRGVEVVGCKGAGVNGGQPGVQAGGGGGR